MIHMFVIASIAKKRRVVYIRDRHLDIMVPILKLNQIRVIKDVVKNLENVWISIMKI